MKVLLDTSVLVAGLVAVHPAHERARPWLLQGRLGQVEVVVAAHSLAETFAVLTSLPVQPRISPASARRLLAESVLPFAKLVALTAGEVVQAIERFADLEIAGGATYDGLIARTAAKAGVDRLVTLDVDDFRRVWPEGGERVVAP